MPKVLLTDYAWDSLDVEKRTLEGIADLVVLNTSNPVEFFPYAEDCDAILNTYAGPITAGIIARLPKCRIIARYGIGVDTIDLDAATAAGIIVTNNPAYCLDEVAEHTMALILAAWRKIVLYDRTVQDGRWSVETGKPIRRLKGSTIGLVGFGNIAQQVALRAAAFGMRVLFADPYVERKPNDVPGEKVSLEQLLEQSDVVSLHVPLTAATRGLIDDMAFAKINPAALLVNAARGAIVDGAALVRALDRGAIAGCALDTIDIEPLPDPHPLRGRDNVILTPHSAWYSEEAMAGLQAGAPAEVRRVLLGEWPKNVVNKEVKGRNRAGL